MENKKLLNIFVVFSIILLIALFIIEYFPTGILDMPAISGHRDFYENIVLGLLTGVIVSAISAFVMYLNYLSRLKEKFQLHILSLLVDLNHLHSKVDYKELDLEEVLRNDADYSVSFYADIIKVCDAIREDIELQNVFLKNRNMYDRTIKKVSELRLYAASISRRLRLEKEVKNLKLLLSGINEKVGIFRDGLIVILIDFAEMQGLQGESLVEYECYLINHYRGE